MAAPDFFTLYDWETQLEGAAASVLTAALTAASITANVYTSQVSSTKQTPWIELDFLPGRALDQRTAIGQASPKIVPNAFEGILLATVVTTRPIDEALVTPLHRTLRGLVRYAFSAGAKSFTGVNLPYIQILDMLPEAAPGTLYDEKEQDKTELAFHLIWAIQNSAWPTSP